MILKNHWSRGGCITSMSKQQYQLRHQTGIQWVFLQIFSEVIQWINYFCGLFLQSINYSKQLNEIPLKSSNTTHWIPVWYQLRYVVLREFSLAKQRGRGSFSSLHVRWERFVFLFFIFEVFCTSPESQRHSAWNTNEVSNPAITTNCHWQKIIKLTHLYLLACLRVPIGCPNSIY